MKIKFLLFLVWSTLVSPAISADIFNVVATVTVNTEAGIKRYKKSNGISPFSGTSYTFAHSDETKVGDVVIEFINYSNTKTETSYRKLLGDLDKAKYRAATIQELCSVQTGVKEINQTELYCFGTQVYTPGLPDLERTAIYKVNVPDNSAVEIQPYSSNFLVPGFVIAAVKIK